MKTKIVFRPIWHWILPFGGIYIAFELLMNFTSIPKNLFDFWGSDALANTLRVFLIVLFIVAVILNMECLVLKPNRIKAYRFIIPSGTVKFSGMPHVAASILVDDRLNNRPAIYDTLDLKDARIYIFISREPIEDNNFRNKPWMRKKTETEQIMEASSGLGDFTDTETEGALVQRYGFIKIVYCEKFQIALENYYNGLAIKDKELFFYHNNRAYF